MKVCVIKLKVAEAAWPELSEELAKHHPSKRAQRLRVLATIGLALSRGDQQETVPPQSTAMADQPSDVSQIAVSTFLRFGGSD